MLKEGLAVVLLAAAVVAVANFAAFSVLITAWGAAAVATAHFLVVIALVVAVAVHGVADDEDYGNVLEDASLVVLVYVLFVVLVFAIALPATAFK